ncbi:Cytochrome P450 71D10 [Morella rubra]|uniref:Cytochrome P450 71D10 n=1 Tax=Morella rubra TaxID=262757 RepID=A0A6A1X0I6_9ROSI|nr:Cytochrome P450 71D10 [Morella rubra]
MQGPSFPFLLLSFFLLLLFVYWKRKSSSGKDHTHKLPPGPWKLPLIGNLHQLVFSSLPHRCFRDLAVKYGPVMQLQMGEELAIILSSPEVAKEVLKTHDLVFSNRPSTAAVDVLSYDRSGIIFTPYGEYWRQMRKICVMEFLSAKRVQPFRSIREEEVGNLIESISLFGGLPINLTEKVYSLTNCITSRAAFGKKCKYEKEFISLIEEIIRVAGGFELPDLFPSLKFLNLLTGMKAAVQEIHRKTDNILDDIINEHDIKARTATSADESIRIYTICERSMADTEAEVDFVSAGSETTATTIEWAMSEMLRNPRVMEKAQAEVRRVLDGRRKIDETDIQKLDYLKSVVKETLRLHPPAVLNMRKSREKCEISGYEIPRNMKVIINVWAIGRDPEYWIDAECFRPERFHSSSVDFKGANFEFIPFGGGRRICPGILPALASIELALSQLLFHFDWKLPNEIKPEELEMSESMGLTIKRKNNLYLIATPWNPFPN